MEKLVIQMLIQNIVLNLHYQYYMYVFQQQINIKMCKLVMLNFHGVSFGTMHPFSSRNHNSDRVYMNHTDSVHTMILYALY